MLTFPSGNKPVHKINIIKKGKHIQMSLEILCTKMSLCIQGCHSAGRLRCFGVCVPVYMCEVVKSVFEHIGTCVHSVIKASGVIKTQTRRPYNLVVTNTSVKMFIILVWHEERAICSRHHKKNLIMTHINKTFNNSYFTSALRSVAG